MNMPQAAVSTVPPVFLAANPDSSASGDVSTFPGPSPTDAPLHLAVFLRGPGASKATWSALTTLATEHRWIATRDRTQAWHLARGRLPTVLIDFAGADIDDDQKRLVVTVGRVEAKYQTHNTVVTLGRLLTTADRARIGDQAWIDTEVTTRTQEAVLPLAGTAQTVQLRGADGHLDLRILVRAVHASLV